MSNLFWGMQFRTCEKFWESTDSGLVLSQNFSQIQKPHHHYFDCRGFATNLKKFVIARFGSAESWQSTKNQSRVSANLETRPLRGAKNRIQGCRSATADFLLEADKRGSPPKSEKAAAFWRVGGAGRGVQPFLQEKTSEISGDRFVESTQESQGGLPRRFCESARNDDFLDSSVATLHQNDNFGLDSALTSFPNNDNLRENAETALDSADSQNLVKKSNKNPLSKFLLLFAFAKRRVLLHLVIARKSVGFSRQSIKQ